MGRFLLILFLIHFACLSQGQLSSKQLTYPLVSQSGDSLTLGELIKGKTAFINFWFIPCGPCFAEMPMLQKIYSRYSLDTNFIFLSISKSSPQAVKQFMTKTESDTTLYRYFKNEVHVDTLTYPILSIAKCQDLILGIVKMGRKYLLKMKAATTEVDYDPPIVFDFDAFPTNMLINKDGKLLFKKTGFNKKTEHSTENEISRAIESALK